MTPRALVFDCDGTLADSMPAHFVAWGDALRPHGLVFPEERFYAAAGMSTREIIEMLAREQGRRVDVAAIALDKDEQYLRHLEHVRPIEPVVAIAREHRGRIPARSVVIPGMRTKSFPAGDYGIPCALIIGQRKASTDKKTSLNEALRDHGVSV